MGSVRICVTFAVEEMYEYEVEDMDDAIEREEELINEAKEEFLSDHGLSEWQGEWYNTLLDTSGADDD